MEYKGFTFNPTPFWRQRDDTWRPRVTIFLFPTPATTGRQYTAAWTCATKEDAKRQSINLAKDFINGKKPDVTFADLR